MLKFVKILNHLDKLLEVSLAIAPSHPKLKMPKYILGVNEGTVLCFLIGIIHECLSHMLS